MEDSPGSAREGDNSYKEKRRSDDSLLIDKRSLSDKGITGKISWIKKYKIQVVTLVLFSLLASIPHLQLNNETSNVQIVGEVSKREVIAPKSFPVYKDPDSLKREFEEVRKNVPILFIHDDSIVDNKIREIDSAWVRAEKILTRKNITSDKKSDSLVFVFDVNLTPQEVDFFSSIRKKDELKSALKQELRSIYEDGFYDINDLEDKEESYFFSIHRNGKETPFSKDLVLKYDEAQERFTKNVETRYSTYADKAELVTKLGLAYLEPNLLPDWESTEKRKQKAISLIKKEIGQVVKDERIVGLHEKITPEIYLKLRSLDIALNNEKADSGGTNRAIVLLGWVIIITIVVFVFAMYLYYFHKNIWDNVRMFLFYFGTMSIMFIAAYLCWIFNLPFLLVPISLVAVLFSIFVAIDLTVFAVAFSTLLVAITIGLDLYTFLSVMIPGIVIAMYVPRLQRRREIYIPIFYSVLAAGLVLILSDYNQKVPFQQMFQRFGIQTISVLIYPFIGLGMLNWLERILNKTSRFTLSEYASPNHPLLEQLSVEGSGTYHHSMLVATLAERAAASISADEILCRVGGYFHDIGKLARPEYFNENDPPQSLHGNLTPQESASILVSHVREGVDIAKSNNLPGPIIDIIKQHHGTTIMRYFYVQAKKMESEIQNNIDDDKPRFPPFTEDDFRYPGPRPQSKEAGILMLTDICEAGVRSLPEKNQETISEQVIRFVDDRVKSGQLDECNLTITDIALIKKTLIKGLLGIHHQRNINSTKSKL